MQQLELRNFVEPDTPPAVGALHIPHQPAVIPASAPFVRDSVTSLEAAKAIEPRAGTLRAKVLAFLRERGSHGATDEEMQDRLGMNPSTQRPRRVELAAAGLIVDCSCRKTRSGRNAVVWMVPHA